MSDVVRVDVDGRLARVELDRPDVLNALDAALIDRLLEVFGELDEDEDVEVVRLSGRGDAFCAGFDLNELRDDIGGMSFEHYQRHTTGVEQLQAMSRLVRASDAIFVGAVHGYAVGAGCELAMICDIAVSTEETQFGFSETNVGLSITNGVTNALPRTIGLQRAKLMTLTGEFVDGREAREQGLVADAVPEGELDDRVGEIIESILDRAPTAITLTKHLLNAGSEVSYEESLEREANAGQYLLRRDEYERMISSFFEE